jgi:hypothetical protein
LADCGIFSRAAIIPLMFCPLGVDQTMLAVSGITKLEIAGRSLPIPLLILELKPLK